MDSEKEGLSGRASEGITVCIAGLPFEKLIGDIWLGQVWNCPAEGWIRKAAQRKERSKSLAATEKGSVVCV